MRAVGRLSDGFIAVGDGPSGGIDWTSADGRSWKRTEFPSKVLRNADLSALAVGTDQIVAAGSISSLTGTSRPALWATGAGGGWSLAGGSWSLVADPDGGTAEAAGATEVGTMAGVVATPSGFVAVGDIDQKAYAWRSADGLTWQERHVLPSVGPADMWQLVAGPGGLLATGEDFGPSGWRATIWRSTDDGRTWAETTSPTDNLDTVTADAVAYWAFGWDGAADGSDSSPHEVFRSTDGLAWQKVGSLPGGDATDAVAIPTSTGEMVAVATTGQQPGSTSTVFVSQDGASWTRETTLGATTVAPANSAAIIATDDSIIVIGARADRPAAWIAVAAAVAPPPAPPAPIAHPAGWCPSGTIDLPTILSLSQPDRLRCFGARTIRFHAFILQPEDLGGTCGCSASPTWLADSVLGYPASWLAPLDAPFGGITPLPAFARPSVPGTDPALRWVAVTGHFDDPASSTCRIHDLNGGFLVSVAKAIADCRRAFVMTKIVTIAAPDPTAGLRIAAPYVVEPSDAGIDGVPAEVKALGMAEVWQNDASVATILALRTALSTTATATFDRSVATENGGTARRTILGISVAFSADGETSIFSLGHRTFVVAAGASPDATTRAKILAITTALIRANR